MYPIKKLMFREVATAPWKRDDDYTSLYSRSVLNCAITNPFRSIISSHRAHNFPNISIARGLSSSITIGQQNDSSKALHATSRHRLQHKTAFRALEWKGGAKTIMCYYFSSKTYVTENEVHEDYFKCALTMTIRFVFITVGGRSGALIVMAVWTSKNDEIRRWKDERTQPQEVYRMKSNSVDLNGNCC